MEKALLDTHTSAIRGAVFAQALLLGVGSCGLGVCASCSFDGDASRASLDGDGAVIDGAVAADVSPPSLDADICEWTVRRLLEVNGAGLSEELSNFPVLVVLNSSRFDYSIGRPNGGDLRFVMGAQELAYEIDTWNPGGDSLVWVKVPAISVGTGAAFYMLYGNVAAPIGAQPTSVWTNGYAAVYHLRSDLIDSSGKGNDATDMGGTSEAAGQVGKARAFNGTSQYLDVSAATSINDLATFSYSAWIYPTSSGDREILSKASSNRELRLREDAPDTILRGCLNYSETNACSDTVDGTISLNSWQQVAMTFDASDDTRAHLFIGGTEVSYDVQETGEGARGDDASSSLNIGRRTSGGRYFAGRIDELRISSLVRSADWILTTNRASRDLLISYGDEESACID